MAQARTPAGSGAGTGVGSEQTGSETTTLNAPEALTWEETVGVTNNMKDGTELLEIMDQSLFSGTVEATSADFVFTFMAKDKGRIKGIRYKNGSVAMSGSVGWELDFVNTDQASVTCAYFGFGTGTEAAKATDKVDAVAANAEANVSNSITTNASHFDKGDVISVTADRDGTTGVGSFVLEVSYESQGHV